MFESLFGAETPLAVRFFIAFVVVFALIGATAWLVRRFGVARLGSTNARGRQPRLAVIEAGAVDGRRRLVLIRRDNVEHLLMIGGPSDIVVEANIVRGQPASREAAPARATATEQTRPAPAAETTWPLAPEPGPRQRPAALEESLQWALPPEPAPVMAPVMAPAPAPVPAAPAARRTQRPVDTLSGLAQELSRPAAVSDFVVAPPRGTTGFENFRPAAQPAPQPAMAAAQGNGHDSGMNGGDQNLAEMAQRLEAALRRPGSGPVATPSRAGLASAPRIDSLNGSAREKAAAPEAAAAPNEAAAAFGSLEQEMASLLGRPPGKA